MRTVDQELTKKIALLTEKNTNLSGKYEKLTKQNKELRKLLDLAV